MVEEISLSEIREYAQGLYNRAQTHIADLESYGISVDTQTALLTSITEFNNYSPQTRIVSASGKRYTTEIAVGFKNAAKAAKAVIMEPIMKLEVITPEENMGDIVGDLNRRRGQVSDMGDRAGAKTVKATVPLSEMFGYVTTLRTLSSGRATSTMEFSHYAETPSNISEEVIKAAKGVES